MLWQWRSKNPDAYASISSSLLSCSNGNSTPILLESWNKFDYFLSENFKRMRIDIVNTSITHGIKLPLKPPMSTTSHGTRILTSKNLRNNIHQHKCFDDCIWTVSILYAQLQIWNNSCYEKFVGHKLGRRRLRSH